VTAKLEASGAPKNVHEYASLVPQQSLAFQPVRIGAVGTCENGQFAA
jgi:hypothetical protein